MIETSGTIADETLSILINLGATKSFISSAALKRIHYLGNVISDEGITVAIVKVKAIMEWPVPTNVTKVRSFMGLLGYYQRFVKGFSKIANPITEL